MPLAFAFPRSFLLFSSLSLFLFLNSRFVSSLTLSLHPLSLSHCVANAVISYTRRGGGGCNVCMCVCVSLCMCACRMYIFTYCTNRLSRIGHIKLQKVVYLVEEFRVEASIMIPIIARRGRRKCDDACQLRICIYTMYIRTQTHAA